MLRFAEFRHKEAVFLISCETPQAARRTIVRSRRELDAWIAGEPRFVESLSPIPQLPDTAPEIARRMQTASALVGVGPMAAVAGASAQLAVEAALKAGSSYGIVNNGGDLYLQADEELVVGLYGGGGGLAESLALRVTPDLMPLGVCSSSSKMGHSRSFGNCDLALVCAADGALADAAATHGANLVRRREDAPRAAEEIAAIPGIEGVLIIMEETLTLAGRLPQLIKTEDASLQKKVLLHPASGR